MTTVQIPVQANVFMVRTRTGQAVVTFGPEDLRTASLVHARRHKEPSLGEVSVVEFDGTGHAGAGYLTSARVATPDSGTRVVAARHYLVLVDTAGVEPATVRAAAKEALCRENDARPLSALIADLSMGDERHARTLLAERCIRTIEVAAQATSASGDPNLRTLMDAQQSAKRQRARALALASRGALGAGLAGVLAGAGVLAATLAYLLPPDRDAVAPNPPTLATEVAVDAPVSPGEDSADPPEAADSILARPGPADPDPGHQPPVPDRRPEPVRPASDSEQPGPPTEAPELMLELSTPYQIACLPDDSPKKIVKVAATLSGCTLDAATIRVGPLPGAPMTRGRGAHQATLSLGEAEVKRLLDKHEVEVSASAECGSVTTTERIVVKCKH